jgi:hypothetical protein
VHGLLLAVAAWVYLRDPAGGTGFLRCPWYAWTGWQCPGCGGQRALHALLHGRLGEALGHNAFAVVVAGPLLAQGYAAWLAAQLGGWWPTLRTGARFWVLLGLGAAAFAVARNWSGVDG